jgi:23S rRNA (cytidine2498-2'-O)-methyltransferase
MCRAGAEHDLGSELLFLDEGIGAAIVGPGLVSSARRPQAEPAFARQVLPAGVVLGADVAAPESVRDAAVRMAVDHRGKAPFALHVTTPDTSDARKRSAAAGALREAIIERLASEHPAVAERLRRERDRERAGDGDLLQVCLLDRGAAVLGMGPQAQALSRFPGGVPRMRQPKGAPSRAVLKIDEAFEWAGLAPSAGDVVVDFGAAPGGWTWSVAQRRARVFAVDPARLRPDICALRGVVSIQQSAFEFEPPEPVDWLVCDMAWRPLEVGALLARWARQRKARFLLANIKLAMKKKVEIAYRVRRTLEEAGWRNLKMRQLYHDRDEVTVFGHR